MATDEVCLDCREVLSHIVDFRGKVSTTCSCGTDDEMFVKDGKLVVKFVDEENLSTNDESGDEVASDFYNSDGEEEVEELAREEWIPLPMKKVPREILIGSESVIDSRKRKKALSPILSPLPKKIKIDNSGIVNDLGEAFHVPRNVQYDMKRRFDEMITTNERTSQVAASACYGVSMMVSSINRAIDRFSSGLPDAHTDSMRSECLTLAIDMLTNGKK